MCVSCMWHVRVMCVSCACHVCVTWNVFQALARATPWAGDGVGSATQARPSHPQQGC